MSTILDALKQVEERIRNEAAQKSADGLPGLSDPPPPRNDSPVPLKGAGPSDNDEVMKVYSGLVDMLNRIQDGFLKGMSEARAEAKSGTAELAQAVSTLRSEAVRLKEAVQNEFQKRDAEREAGSARLAALQFQTETLKQQIGETGETNAKLLQALTAQKNDSQRLKEAVQKEFQKRDGEYQTANAALAAVQSQTDSLRRLFAEAAASNAALAQTTAALRADATRQAETVQRELQKNDAERRAENAALADMRSQADAAKKLIAAVQASGEELARTVAALRDDAQRQRDAVLKEFQQRDAGREDDTTTLAVMQSQIDALKGLLAGAGQSSAPQAQAVADLQNDFARQTELVRQELQKRDAERDAGKALLAALQSQLDELKRPLPGPVGADAELAQAVTALRDELLRQAEAIQNESRQRDAERAAAAAALAALQSQTDALQQALASREEAVAATAGPALAGMDAPVRQEAPGSAGPAPRPRLDKDEALRLHSAARKAYTRGDFHEALELLDAINAAFPGNASVLYNRAQCLIGLGRNDEARTLCDHLATDLDHAPATALKAQIRD